MPDKKKIVHKKGQRNVLITSALPYVNNVPHLGNVIGSVLSADVFARYCRSRGINTLYICGTDEYGTTTEIRALKEKVTEEVLCKKYYDLHAKVYKWFNIDFDIFGRTTTNAQTEITQDIFLKLHKNGFLKDQTTTQLYCQKHNRFLADRFVEGICPHCKSPDGRGDQCDGCGKLLDPLELISPRCKLDDSTPIQRETNHIFLQLDLLEPEVQKYFDESSTKGAWTKNSKSITAAWLKQGLRPRSITRDMHWGTAIPLKGYDNKVIYPWFDACIGYISITAEYTEDWREWWHSPDDVQLYQFIGKDNVPFHSIVFPASLIGTKENWTKVHHLSTTEYLNYEGGKFSKSRNVGVFGDEAEKSGVSADVWRYYLLKHRPELADTNFDWKEFINCSNGLVLNKFGNYVNRVLKFVASRLYNGFVPDRKYKDSWLDSWVNDINEKLADYIRDMDAVRLRSGSEILIFIAELGNKMLDKYKLSNQFFKEEPDQCASVVNYAVNLIHLLAALAGPYMPKTSEEILKQLNMEPISIPDVWEADTITAGHQIGEPKHLFSHIDKEKEDEWRKIFGSDRDKDKEVVAGAQEASSSKSTREIVKAAIDPEEEAKKAELAAKIAAKKAAKKEARKNAREAARQDSEQKDGEQDTEEAKKAKLAEMIAAKKAVKEEARKTAREEKKDGEQGTGVKSDKKENGKDGETIVLPIRGK